MIEIYKNLWNWIQKINWTALIYATILGNVEVIKLLLEQKDIDVNIVDI